MDQALLNKAKTLYTLENGVSKISNGSKGAAILNNSLALNNAVSGDFGFQIDIDTLTQIRQQVVEQKFYTVREGLSAYVPMELGRGWSENLLTYRTFSPSDDFEAGLMDTGRNQRFAQAETAIDSVSIVVKTWAYELNYGIMEIQKAQASNPGNWSVIEGLERSRKRLWDLGMQKTAFLGHSSDTDVKGLLNQSGVTINTTVIDKFIKDMSDSEFQAFIANVMGAYSANSVSREAPDTFVIPLKDFLGLGSATSSGFPIGTKLEYLTNMFKQVSGNPDAKILPVAYAEKEENDKVKNIYTMYGRNVDNLVMNIPVDYTSTLADTYNGAQFQSVAYGQYTGVQVLRPREIIYFEHAI